MRKRMKQTFKVTALAAALLTVYGSVLADGTLVRTHEHLGRLKDERGSDFLECMYPLDSPFTPEGVRKGLCCPLTVVELEPA